jgi:hypothetical protein
MYSIMADKPPLYVMKKLVSMYNKDLKIVGYSKMKKDALHSLITTRKYTWVKKNNDTWDLQPAAQMKRQKVYTYNKKTKIGGKKTK